MSEARSAENEDNICFTMKRMPEFDEFARNLANLGGSAQLTAKLASSAEPPLSVTFSLFVVRPALRKGKRKRDVEQIFGGLDGG